MNAFTELFESELLNDETKKVLSESIETFKKSTEEDIKSQLEVDYAKRMISEKEKISSEMLSLITESVAEEMVGLKDDVKYAKSIEPKYATLLENFKKEYTEKLSKNISTLVESVVVDEIDELREDLFENKKNQVGVQIFESFKPHFDKLSVTPDIEAVNSELDAARKELLESKAHVDTLLREKTMGTLLSNLNGSKREVMKTLLESVDTDKLQSRFDETLDSVMEGDKSATEKTDKEDSTVVEKTVITESKTEFDGAEHLRIIAGIK